MPRYVDGADEPAAAPASFRSAGDPLLAAHRSSACAWIGASIFSSSINLLNTILGSGMLAMAAGVATLGVAQGVVFILLSALASALGLYFLTLVAGELEHRINTAGHHRENVESLQTADGEDGPASASFYACASATYPHLATLINLAIGIKCFGVGISYLIIIGDLMPEIVDGLGYSLHEHPFLADRRLWISLGMILITPLSFLRRLDSLRYTSLVALSAVVYLVAVVVGGWVWTAELKVAPGVVWGWLHNPSGVLHVLPVFVFAFTCHQNIFAIFNELGDRSQSRLNRVIANSIGTAFLVYILLGVIGYLHFGPNVLPNIIMMYKSGVVVLLGRELLVVLQVFSYPLQCHPCRACIEQILPTEKEDAEKRRVLLPTTERDNRQDDDDGDDSDPRRAKPATSSRFRHAWLTTTILVLSYATAMTVTKLDVVLAFIGATGSTTISFILPGAFYYGLHRDKEWAWRKVLATSLAVFGVVMMAACLTANIIKLHGASGGGRAPGAVFRDGPGGL